MAAAAVDAEAGSADARATSAVKRPITGDAEGWLGVVIGLDEMDGLAVGGVEALGVADRLGTPEQADETTRTIADAIATARSTP